jgi:thiamine pyrophosphate-dependent acetolactate synthase large subunit-like protein
MTVPIVTTPRTSRAADSLAEALVVAGARHVFGMPGSHTITLYDALALRHEIETILVRNEQAGAFMADGYARVTGAPGYVCTTAGPGATNALTGVAEAWADSTPVVLLAGQVNADRLDVECGAYHEIDLESIYRPVTKFCATVREADSVASLFARAFAAATSGRSRPVALILPQDLMRAEIAMPFRQESAGETSIPEPDREALDHAAALLASAERPILLAGGGALWSGAAEEMLTLARRLRAPIVTTLNAKGLIDERDPMSLGHARSARARVAMPHADAMLAVGCRFTEVMTAWRTMPVPEQLVQIDIDPTQIGMNHPVAVGIVADARAALRELLARVPARECDAWDTIWNEARQARPSRPEWLIETLREVVPEYAPVFTDACEIGYRMQTDWVAHAPRQFFYPSNYITLGWAFPAAIGAAVALKGKSPVFSVSGDGGFLMTAQELATAARYGLSVVAVVHNDSTYGAIKNLQSRHHAGRYRDVELNNPDFLALAAAFSVPSVRVTRPESLRRAVHDALSRVGPTLIEVPDDWRSIRAGG